MKTAKIVKAGVLELKAFELSHFMQTKVVLNTEQSISKKEIKALAKALSLDADDEKIIFTKKIMTAYRAKR